MLEDRILLLRFKAGSEEALETIYRKYKNRLLGLACSMTHDGELAEDIVHDVFVSFAQSAHRMGLNGSLKGFLATCVVNRLRNVMKRRQREQALAAQQLRQADATARNREPWIRQNEAFDLLNETMMKLSDEQREVVLLHLKGEMTFRAISGELGVSINTVQSRYRYGLNKLRSLLNKEMNP